MDVQRTAVDNTPLMVNLLRLIRNARSPNYKDHEKGPVTFHFGGLCMRDTGSYTEAEELWRHASVSSAAPHSPRGSSPVFHGPLHLVVTLNDVPVEVWTLQDYREHATDHSVPRDFEQLEQLNTLVRVLFAHLRCQEIYGVVLQSCVSGADDSAMDSRAAASPLSPLSREATLSAVSSPHSRGNSVALHLYATGEGLPSIPAGAQRHYLWSSEDFARVDVVVNKSWRYQTAPPAVTAPMAVLRDTDQRCSSPIKASSSASRPLTGGSSVPSPSTSPEFFGSLAKSSLPTPHLAPATASPSSINRPASTVSPLHRSSPLLPMQRRSPMPAMSDLALPPPELSDLYECEAARHLRSSVRGRPTTSATPSLTGSSTVRPGALLSSPPPAVAAAHSAVGHLEDALLLSEAEHVRLMGTLVSTGKEVAPVPASSLLPLDAQRWVSSPHVLGSVKAASPKYPQRGSLLAAASVGAISGLELDSQLGWSSPELDDLAMEEEAELGIRPAAVSEDPQRAAARQQLMALLGLCTTAQLHHVTPAPFGDLVMALNLRDVTQP